MATKNEFGKWLRSEIARASITKAQLAVRAGVHSNVVSRYCTGAITNMSVLNFFYVLRALCHFHGYTRQKTQDEYIAQALRMVVRS